MNRNWWDRWTDWVTEMTGGRWAFSANVLVTLAWIAAGPFYGWSDRWQLWANTITTVVTYLMVFVIQHAQNRSDAATQVKLDELLRALPQPRSELAGVDRLGEDEIRRRRNEVTPNDV